MSLPQMTRRRATGGTFSPWEKDPPSAWRGKWLDLDLAGVGNLGAALKDFPAHSLLQIPEGHPQGLAWGSSFQ